MTVKTFALKPIMENCYVVSEGKECAIIDCGALLENEWAKIKRHIADNELTPKYALQTHMHFDHVYGLYFVKRDYGIGPLCHMLEEPVYEQAGDMSRSFIGQDMNIPLPKVERHLRDGERLSLGGKTIEVIHTPGHTPGGLCFYIEEDNILFSGDTLFQGSIGRTDLPGGSMSMEISSITERLLCLPEETLVYPGHGDRTNIGWEKKHNMYF